MFFAVDNTYFANETVDGKAFKVCVSEVITSSLELSEAKNLAVAPYHNSR